MNQPPHYVLLSHSRFHHRQSMQFPFSFRQHLCSAFGSISTNTIRFTCLLKTFACVFVPVDDYLPFFFLHLFRFETQFYNYLFDHLLLFFVFFFCLFIQTFGISFWVQWQSYFNTKSCACLRIHSCMYNIYAHVCERVSYTKSRTLTYILYTELHSLARSLTHLPAAFQCVVRNSCYGLCICVKRFISQFYFIVSDVVRFSVFFGIFFSSFTLDRWSSDRRLPFQIRWHVTFLSWIATASVRAVYT